MSTRLLTMLLMIFALTLGVRADDPPPEDEGQLPACSPITKSTELFQHFDGNGDPEKVLEEYFETSTAVSGCLFYSKVTGSTDSVNGTAVSDGYSFPNAWVGMIFYPSSYGTYTARGRHYLAWFGVNALTRDYGQTTKQVTMVEPEVPSGCGEEWENPVCGGDSPLLIDIEGDGFNLTGPQDGVQFDLDNDGSPESIGWTASAADDAFLAMDRNGNGVVDNGSELFGNHTPVYFGHAMPTAANGFEALKFLESPQNGPSIGDNQAAAGDPGFEALLLWVDANHNGYSERWELRNAAATGLTGISTDYRESRRRDRYGNEFRQVSDSTWLRNRRLVTRKVVDVWFASR